MSDRKCEWIDGLYRSCEDAKDIIIGYDQYCGFIDNRRYVYKTFFCPFCGADIRKPEPEPTIPTHREIMTRWWKQDNGSYSKPLSYYKGFYIIICHKDYEHDHFNEQIKAKLSDVSFSTCTKEYFTGRQSEILPPESTN